MTDDGNFEFDLNLDKLFAQLADLPGSTAVNHQACLFLLLLWGYFEISLVKVQQAAEGEPGGTGTAILVTPTVIDLKQAYQIFDYGSSLKTSPGKHYGSYTTGRLLTTVKAMIDLLIKRGAKQVQFNGLAAAKRFAWMECEKHNISVVNFKPDVREKVVQLNRMR